MKLIFSALSLALLQLSSAIPALAQESGIATAAPTRFTVEVVGSGPDIILIPGLATPRDVWWPTADALKDSYRVHLVQVRGFGDTPGPNAQGPVLNDLVTELAAYIRRERLRNPAVIGHSLGGLAGLMLAADYPDLLGRLMIVDALPFYGVLMARPGMAVTAQSIEPQARMVRDQVASTYGQTPDPAAIHANAASQALTASAREKVAHWIASADPRVMAQLVYDDMTTDMRGRVAEIRAPLTLIYPWNETYPTRQQAESFYSAEYASLPGATLLPVGPSGHFVMLDKSAEMQAAIHVFLESKPSK